MHTTIQISSETKQSLDKLRLSLQSSTYDEIIRKLLAIKTASMAGKLGEAKKYSTREIMRGLRDERERI